MESLTFLENKRENSLNFSLYHHQQGAKSLIGKKKLKRAIVPATGQNCLKLLLLIIKNSHQSYRVRSTCVTEVGCPF